jgi:hypothetical protein
MPRREYGSLAQGFEMEGEHVDGKQKVVELQQSSSGKLDSENCAAEKCRALVGLSQL